MTEKPRPLTTSKEMIKQRELVKKRKPTFRRHESWRYKRLKESWRKPRGLDNKMRQEKKGWPKPVKIGYGGPRRARGLHPSGYIEVIIHTPDEIEHVNSETQAIRIAHTVGIRKRIQITTLARGNNIYLINPLVRPEIEEEEEGILEESLEEDVTPDKEEIREEEKIEESVREEGVESGES